MYYEEKIINGVLMFRNNPSGDWQQCSIVKMGLRIHELQNKLEIARSLFEELSDENTYRLGEKSPSLISDIDSFMSS